MKAVLRDWRGFLLLFMSLLLGVVAVLSLRWRMDFDSPLLLYVAYLLDHGYVPYRDIYDVNFPVTYLINLAIGRFLGYDDLAYRIGDLVYLTATMTVSWQWLRRLGPRVAWFVVVAFSLFYLGYGPLWSLQRDFLLLLPINMAILLVVKPSGARSMLELFVLGFLFALACLIKPHAILALPAVVIYCSVKNGHEARRGIREIIAIILPITIGFSAAVLAAVMYLWRAGALPHFLEIITQHLPRFAEISGANRTVIGLLPQLEYRSLEFSRYLSKVLLLVPAATGAFLALRDTNQAPERRHIVHLILGLTMSFSVYVLAGGKFWDYHWIPFFFFCLVLVSLCFEHSSSESIATVVFLVFVLQFLAPLGPTLYYGLQGGGVHTPRSSRVDALAGFLEDNLEPGDKVQPLDWTDGTLNAMLRTRTEVATPFIYTYMFFHHVSSDYTQELRVRFVTELRRTKPRFIIETRYFWGWIQGEDTSNRFRELEQLLSQDYTVALKASGYTIHELTTM